MNPIPRIAVFASGSGSNAQRIAEYFEGRDLLEISAIYCNNPDAYVLERANMLGIHTVLFTRSDFYQTTSVLDDLNNREIDWIVLAGFLWLIPDSILKAYPQRIINIHPALLPAYGGKGMYGMKVHESVIASGEKQSGITIHHVNESYDEGDIIFQATCQVHPGDTPEMLAAKIHELEYEYFPVVIGKLVAG
ncbi:MAG: phosphoribosylglycinamide formyltransferase [Bacteroidales bacterium]|nr:phosphoribosylglycinamide formyltransferase [Bacteroidales bacterium]